MIHVPVHDRRQPQLAQMFKLEAQRPRGELEMARQLHGLPPPTTDQGFLRLTLLDEQPPASHYSLALPKATYFMILKVGAYKYPRIFVPPSRYKYPRINVLPLIQIYQDICTRRDKYPRIILPFWTVQICQDICTVVGTLIGGYKYPVTPERK